MKHYVINRKILSTCIFVIISSILFFSTFNSMGFVTRESQVKSIQQEEPEDKAFTDINLTLFEDTVIYERTTHTNPIDIPPDMEMFVELR